MAQTFPGRHRSAPRRLRAPAHPCHHAPSGAHGASGGKTVAERAVVWQIANRPARQAMQA